MSCFPSGFFLNLDLEIFAASFVLLIAEVLPWLQPQR
jgi:hypothetical protein